MAFNGNTQWDVKGATGNDANGGGFAYGLGVKTVSAATDLAVDSSNPKLVTSATHTFVTADINKFINVTAGVNWILDWFQILSISGSGAILDKAPARVSATGGTYDLYTAIDYSQLGASPQIAYTDMKIDATTNTKFTSVNNPVDDKVVGNVINVVSGGGFTVQRVQIISQAAGVATCDKSLGTLGSTGGNGNLGGSLATIQAAVTLGVSNTGQRIHIQSATYTLTTAISVTQASISLIGYQTNHYDGGTKPLITTATNSTILFTFPGTNAGLQQFNNLSLSNTATTRAAALTQLTAHGTSQIVAIINCLLDGFTIGLDFSNTGSAFDINNLAVINTEIKNCTTRSVHSAAGNTWIQGCDIHNCTGNSTTTGAIAALLLSMSRTLVTDNSGAAVTIGNSAGILDNNTIANNVGDGFAPAASGFMVLSNNIFYNNGKDIHTAGASNAFTFAQAIARNNAYSSGFTTWIPNQTDILFTGDPFTNASTRDYSLGSSSSATLLKQAGFPGRFPSGTSQGYLDIGAVQSPAASEPGSYFVGRTVNNFFGDFE